MGKRTAVMVLILLMSSAVFAEEVAAPVLHVTDEKPQVTVNGKPITSWKKAPDFAEDFAHYLLELPSIGYAQLTFRQKSGAEYRMNAVLRPGVAFEWIDGEGPLPVRVLPGARCGLIPKAHGLKWYKCQEFDEEPLSAGRVFSLDRCSRPAMVQHKSVTAEGEDGGSAVLFFDTVPGLYRFEMKNGRIVVSLDEKAQCRVAQDPAADDAPRPRNGG